jgi:hypothetical protein
MSQVNFYSKRKNWGKLRVFKSRGRITSPWINCQFRGIPVGSVGSTSNSKMIWPKMIDLLLIIYRDIVLGQQSEKWNYPEIYRIIRRIYRDLDPSWVSSKSFYFIIVRLTFLFRITGKFFRVSAFFAWSAIAHMTTISCTTVSWKCSSREKYFTLRIGSNLGGKEGRLAEHILILGLKQSQGQKTNCVILIPPKGFSD